jgi:hypothetical protein
VFRTEVEYAVARAVAPAAIGIYPHLLDLVSQTIAVGIHIRPTKVGKCMTHGAALVVKERIGIVAVYL